MKSFKLPKLKLLLSFLVAGIFILAACHNREAGYESEMIHKVYVDKSKKPAMAEGYAIEAPSMDFYPCNDCHADQEPNPARRELIDMHDDISGMFDHDKENRWCTDCHDLNQRDSLHLASGERIGFDVSYKLCGQCHGDKLRDWKVGVHGKRIGMWNGRKEYFLCVHCHNPHSPRFKPLEPKAPPTRPEDIN